MPPGMKVLGQRLNWIPAHQPTENEDLDKMAKELDDLISPPRRTNPVNVATLAI